MDDQRKSEIKRKITYNMDMDVHGYGYKPSVYFIGRNLVQSALASKEAQAEHAFFTLEGLPMGMELEVEYRRDVYCDIEDVIHTINKEAMSRAYVDRFNEYDNDVLTHHTVSPVQFFIAKTDGSLSDGIEFVSQPMSLGVWRDIPLVFEDYNDVFAAFHRRTTGLHIHVPKAAFTDSHLFTWMLLMQTLGKTSINHNTTGSLLSLIGQRRFNNWARFEQPTVSAEVKSKLAQVAIDRTNTDGQRYKYLNLHPQHTIELRFFKANLKTNRLLKNLEFVDSTYEYTKMLDTTKDSMTILDSVLSASDWYEYIQQEKYSNLTEYLRPYEHRFGSQLDALDTRYDLDNEFDQEVLAHMKGE